MRKSQKGGSYELIRINDDKMYESDANNITLPVESVGKILSYMNTHSTGEFWMFIESKLQELALTSLESKLGKCLIVKSPNGTATFRIFNTGDNMTHVPPAFNAALPRRQGVWARLNNVRASMAKSEYIQQTSFKLEMEQDPNNIIINVPSIGAIQKDIAALKGHALWQYFEDLVLSNHLPSLQDKSGKYIILISKNGKAAYHVLENPILNKSAISAGALKKRTHKKSSYAKHSYAKRTNKKSSHKKRTHKKRTQKK